MKTYIASWKIQGLPDTPVLPPGGTIDLEEKTAAPLVKGGSLSLFDKKAEGGNGNDPDPDVDLSAMTKAMLVEYAREKLELELDVNRNKDTLLAAIVEAAGK
ncbi:MAG: hypothetical protein JXR49_19595 [Acidobacteria bacterium]|nr:hypothetical protein [Acidobacteriota bacterium]